MPYLTQANVGMTPPATTRSHLSSPLLTAGGYKRKVVHSSPSTLSKDTLMTRLEESKHRFKHEVPAWDFPGSDCSNESPTYSTRMMVITKPQGLVTPDYGVGETEIVTPSTSSFHPLSLPTFLPFNGSNQSKYERRISVGLPSQYPTHDRANSLASSVLEEIQDFDEFFEPPRFLEGRDCMDVDNENVASLSPSKEQRRPLLRDTATGESRHKRRSRNRAMGTEDFYNLVLKEL